MAGTINQNSYDKNTFDNMEWSNDIFDILNDDINDEKQEEEELENIMEQYNQDFDFDYLHTNVDEEEMMMMTIEDDNNKNVEEQILSQKLSQLSTKDENDQVEDYFTSNNKKRSLSTSSTPDVDSKRYNLSSDHWNQVLKLIPNYKKLTPYQFKDVLVKVISFPAYDQIQEWLTNFPLLQFLQQRAEIMCTVFQLKIEQDYWNYIANLTIMPAMIWLSEMSKDVTKQNSINWDHTKTKTNIQRRQQIIERKLQQAEHHLNIHLQQPYPFYWQIPNDNFMDQFVNIISNALVIVVENSLCYFRTNFEQKKILLHYDMNDVYLVKSFYDLNPTEEQISIVQKIWRTNLKFCKRAICQKKKNQSLAKNQIAMERIHHDQDNHLFPIESFIPSMCTIIEARLTNMEQRAQELMKFDSTIDDNNFF